MDGYYDAGFFRVENLIEGHDYNFRVKAVNKEGESQPLKGDYPVTAKDPFGKPGQPGQPQATGDYKIAYYYFYFFNSNVLFFYKKFLINNLPIDA